MIMTIGPSWAVQGWSYEEVLPIFKKLENDQTGGESKYHSSEGEWPVVKPQDVNATAKRFVKAGRTIGLPHNPDFNASSQLGLGIYNVTQNKGTRVSSYTAFVEPILKRPNLTILTHAKVKALDIEGDCAKAVNIVMNETDKKLICNKEIILSAGAIDSPRILLASGIGNKNDLDELGITCKHNVVGVGENLQDHLDSMVTIRSKKAESIGVSWKSLLPDVITAPFKYYFNKMGWWTTNYVEAGGFAELNTPIITIQMFNSTSLQYIGVTAAKDLSLAMATRFSLVYYTLTAQALSS